MNKVKLTQEQAKALDIALDFCLGDAEMLIQAHRRVLAKGEKWEGQEIAPLNNLTAETVEAALKYDYEIVKPKAKLPRAAIKSLEYLAYETGLNTDVILRLHKQNPNTWMDKGDGLNGMAYELLEQAINKGYELDEQASILQHTNCKHVISQQVDIGMKVRALKGQHAGKELTINFIRTDKKLFGVDNGVYFRVQDQGKWWELVYTNAQEQPVNSDLLQLSDYKALIDLALATSDKAWFDELVAKLKEVVS